MGSVCALDTWFSNALITPASSRLNPSPMPNTMQVNPNKIATNVMSWLLATLPRSRDFCSLYSEAGSDLS